MSSGSGILSSRRRHMGPKWGVGTGIDQDRFNTIAPIYFYGFPAHGASEASVKAQFLFDEPSGSIVDEVAGLTLTAAGTPTYNYTTTGYYASLSPGIFYNSGDRHANSSAASIAPGTKDFTVESWFRLPGPVNNDEVIFNFQNSSNQDIMYLSLRTNIDVIQFFWTEPGVGSTVTNLSYALSGLIDGLPHKLRMPVDRDGNVVVYIDGVSAGSNNVSARSGQSIPSDHFSLGNYYSSGLTESLALFEWRLSLNLTNNSGGPNGG